MGLFSKLFKRKSKNDADFLSMVYLLREPQPMDDPRLAAMLAALVKSVFKMSELPATEIKQASETAKGLVIAEQPFVVIGVSERYVA